MTILTYTTHKALLAFETPKCGVMMTNIGILNAKKEAFKMPKLAFKFYEMNPMSLFETSFRGFIRSLKLVFFISHAKKPLMVINHFLQD